MKPTRKNQKIKKRDKKDEKKGWQKKKSMIEYKSCVREDKNTEANEKKFEKVLDKPNETW